jgi:ubiquinone biosynthesis protein
VRLEARDRVQALLESELAAPVDELFADFDWTPVAAASIGQAYRARLASGECVIVKVQRPGVSDSVERDLDVLDQLVGVAEARVSWAKTYDVRGFVTEFADRLREELDFRVEARNAADVARADTAGSGVYVPHVYQDLTTRGVLVVEWLDGVSVRDAGGIDALGVDRDVLAENLTRSFLRQMLIEGRFHADPHPGNVLVMADGRIGLIDFGAVGRLDPIQQTAVRQMMFAVGQRNPALLRQAVLDVATIRPGFDDDLFERGLARFMARHLGPGATPSAAMFNDLLQVFFSFGVSLPPEFGTLFRALVTLEGTLTTLRPGYSVIDAAQRVAGEWAAQRLTVASMEEFAKDEVVKLAPVLRRLPQHLDRLATLAARGDLRTRVSLLSAGEDVQVLTRWLNRLILAFLGGVVGIMSVVLISIKGGPDFTGQTSLYEFFGYFGLFCSSILIMRVLISIFRDGLN